MKISLTLCAAWIASAAAFAPSTSRPSFVTSVSVAADSNQEVDDSRIPRQTAFPVLNRRHVFQTIASTATAAALANPLLTSSIASAASIQSVLVAGATGQTGRRILERLAADSSLQVAGGVRNIDKAQKSLSESSTVLRGAMVQQVSAISSESGVTLKQLDVVQNSVDDMASALKNTDALVIAVGFIPGNPLKMNQAAHEVDNVGTCKLIDAAKQAGVKKIVLVSSILTNARAIGKEKSPGFVVTNAFGNVLDEKLVAENYLRQSGIDYTIVRPGGLKAKPPTGDLRVYGEDQLEAGEISRDYVADVCVAALTDPKASNKVLEIIEDDGTPPQVFNGLNM